jgi:hypothetical protein
LRCGWLLRWFETLRQFRCTHAIVQDGMVKANDKAATSQAMHEARRKAA